MKQLNLALLLFILLPIYGTAQTVRDFSLENLDGEWMDYNDLKGEQLTIIDFWASWCKPCMKAMPEIEKLYQTFKDDGVNVISINTDGPRSISKVLPLSQTLNVTYPILSDINNDLTSELNISVLPTMLVVNSDGKIIWRHEGWTSGDEAKVEQHIKEALQ